jgi:hypothetical protein
VLKWTKFRLFFFFDFWELLPFFIFVVSNETEVGSAGEQPARDSLTTEIIGRFDFVRTAFILVFMP